MSINWKKDFRGIVSVDKYLATMMDKKMKHVARAIVDEVRGNWSDTRPSTGGNPPAIDTGAYHNSLSYSNSVRQGRDEWGRFVSVYTAVFNTDEAERPRQYAMALEKGTSRMEARPHIQPAIDRVKGRGAYLLR